MATDQNICDIIQRRHRFSLIVKPGTRYNPVSPYPNFTKLQLDMRRKTEILQYKKQSSKTNQLTKSQRFSSVVSNTYSANTRNICNEDLTIPTSTTSCDVPGPPMILQYNPNVPLYNYQINSNTSAFINVQPPIWQIDLSNNLLPITTTINSLSQINSTNTLPETYFLTLAIEGIQSDTYNFELGMPISVYLKGINYDNNNITGSFILNNAKLNVYYYPSATTYYSQSLALDVSGSFNINPNSSFICVKNIGFLDFKNIPLSTNYGDIYDYKMVFNFTIKNISNMVLSNSNILGNLIAGVCFDISNNYISNNCTITTNGYKFQNYFLKGTSI